MSHSQLEFIKHIIDEVEYLKKSSLNLTKEMFLTDETLKRSFVRSLEIIGEASKQIPESLRSKYPIIPWKPFAGMRDKLIHGYFGVDYEIVWDVIINKIPGLKLELEKIIHKET